MRYSYNWLKDLSGTTSSAEEIAEKITMHSFEVEEIQKVGSSFEKVVVGEILEIEKHPNADKLQITKVDIGKEKLQIVCGANNISVGDKVPVALVGAKLKEDFIIKEAEIRGVKSFGMLCALDELGLGNDHSGIMLLDKSLKIGTAFSEIASVPDTILEIKVLPDRAHDALSHIGMAREIAALEETELDYDYDNLILSKKKTDKIKIEIENPELCTRYIGAVLENIKVEKSPEWLSSRLERCGIKSINNVVDVTNLVMLELGQPMHAFDFEKITKSETAKIFIRNAKNTESIKILDGSEKVLTGADIIIASGEEALAIAGVMGGADSGITENTKTIVLEAATFNATSVRKTRQRLNLPTDAALRFEKEIDPNLAEKAMVRAIELLENLTSARFAGSQQQYAKEKKPWKIELNLEYVDKLLGENVPKEKSIKILQALGYKIKATKNSLSVTVPTFRIDSLSAEDLIEEIGRINGYEKITEKALLAAVVSPMPNERNIFTKKIKNILVSLGFSEILSYGFYGKKEVEIFGLEKTPHLELECPLSPELSLMRISIIPGILSSIAENLKRFEKIKIFEIGKVYWKNGKELPIEKNMLVGVLALENLKNKEKNTDKRKNTDFFLAKSSVEALLQKNGISDFYFDEFKAHTIEEFAAAWHSGRTAQIKIMGSGETLGFLGEINPALLVKLGIEKRIVVFEFDLEKLEKVASEEREFSQISKYPTVSRDISMIAGQGILVDEILALFSRIGKEMLIDSELFDIFDFEDGTSSYGFHLIFGSKEKTLTSKEIDQIMENIIQKLQEEFEIKIRK
jgi:phenylalanyl-tRNA synthetase beta chain